MLRIVVIGLAVAVSATVAGPAFADDKQDRDNDLQPPKVEAIDEMKTGGITNENPPQRIPPGYYLPPQPPRMDTPDSPDGYYRDDGPPDGQQLVPPGYYRPGPQ